MKRINLVVNENLLPEATRVLGVKTYSAAVNTALAEVLRFRRILNLPSAFDQGLWQGDLSQMREDQIASGARAKKKRIRTRKH
jgi:Arc/MetJ family transcription regulator